MTKKFNIAAYCRSSVSTSHNNSSSIEHQKAIINDFIKTNYPDSTVTFYEDTEHSGTIVKNLIISNNNGEKEADCILEYRRISPFAFIHSVQQ